MKSAGDQETWEWLFERYRNETNAQEKTKLLRGLTSIEVPWLLRYIPTDLYLCRLYSFYVLIEIRVKTVSFSNSSRLIELARDISNVREQDYFTLLGMISNNRVGEPIVWDFYRNEWEYLVERFTLHDRLLGRVCGYLLAL